MLRSGFLNLSSFFHGLFFHNKGQKLLAVCFALIIWIMATYSLRTNTTEIILPVILTYSGQPDTLVIKSPLPNKVNANLFIRGLNTLKQSDFIIRVDLSTIRSGSNNISLKDLANNFPENTESFSIEPTFINVIAEEAAEKTVPVKLRYEGELKEGYTLENIQVFPAEIRIRGPKSQADNIQFVETDMIDLQNEDRSFIRVSTPKLPEFFSLVNETNINLSVSGTVKTVTKEAEFKNLPLRIIGTNYKIFRSADTVNVRISGPVPLMNTLVPENLEAVIDVTDFLPGNYSGLNIAVNIPDGLDVIEIKPNNIKITLRK